ncbi:MAG: nucleotide sugar dehydrogenase, partial [Pseudomonadota bacterium]|nr:nucleotide sugar dehydrogenase [Pseudomonadota bacterium]
MVKPHHRIISVMGLGYVGLPVALAFGQYSQVIGFDINHQRIAELNQGFDRTQELSAEAFQNNHIQFTTAAADLHQADFHIIAVPTPIDAHKHPDLLPVLKASKT